MAARYWVGGTGNWSETSHWSATSGGTGGASVPTSADDVYFNAFSFTGTSQSVTINVAASCLSMYWTGATNNPTLKASGSVSLSVYGYLTFIAGMSVSRGTATTFSLSFLGGAGGVRQITCGTATNMGAFTTITFNGTGSASWQLQDDFNAGSANIAFIAGTLNTNGKAVANTSSFNFSSSSAKTLTLGASTLSCGSFSIPDSVASSTTLNAGTSTIAVLGNFTGGGKTYYNVSITASGLILISGANTFNNLTYNPNFTRYNELVLAANQVIIGTLTLTGNPSNRICVRSDFFGVQRTLSAAVVACTYTDFNSIAAAGSGNWALTNVTTGAGDAGNNTGISYKPAVTRYFVSTGGSLSWSDSVWASTSGGAASTSMPCCHDNVIFDANSSTGGNLTLSLTILRLGRNISFTNVTAQITLTCYPTYKLYVHGNLTLSPLVYFSATGAETIRFCPITPSTITSSGAASIPNPIELYGDVTLADALSLSGKLTHSYGHFDDAGKNVSCAAFDSTGSVARALTRTGNWTINISATSGNPWSISTTGLTINSNTGPLKITGTLPATRVFGGGGIAYGQLWIAVSGAFALTLTGSNTFGELKIDAGRIVSFGGSTTTTVDAFDCIGSEGNIITLQSNNTNNWNLVYTGVGNVECDYLSIARSQASPADTWYAGANSVDNGNNTGWIFTAIPGAFNNTADPLFFGDII